MTDNRLHGTWRLASLKFEFAATRESTDMYGPEPLGCLIITPGGHMTAIVTSAGREAPSGEAGEAALFKSVMAYSGPYRLEGEDQFITDVEVAWHPAWVGTEQARSFIVDGNTLSIITAEVQHPMFPGRPGRGVLKWHRIGTQEAS